MERSKAASCSNRRSWIILLVAAAVHLAVLLPLVGPSSTDVDGVYYPKAEGFVDGQAPYSALHFEYPPGAVPIFALPALVGKSVHSFRVGFELWMVLWDLAILAVLTIALRRNKRALVVGLALYTVGLLVLGKLVITRFDLVPAALALAAVVLQQARRSTTWGLALGAATAVKAWAIGLLPLLLQTDRRKLQALVGVALPIGAILAFIWVAYGDEPWSAIAYHAKRGLQIESLAATPFLIAKQFGAAVTSFFNNGSGSFEIAASGVKLARELSIAALIVAYLIVTWLLLRRHARAGLAAAAVTGLLVILAPVFSPQFMIWILPLAVVSAPLRWETLVLVLSCVLTRLTMMHYGNIGTVDASFVWPLAARNLALALWVILALRLALNTKTPSSEKIS